MAVGGGIGGSCYWLDGALSNKLRKVLIKGKAFCIQYKV